MPYKPKSWKPIHGDWVRPRDERPSASARGYDGGWRRLRKVVLGRDRRCYYCGAPAVHVHHVVPLDAGGTNQLSNLMPVCHACHNRVTHRKR